MFYETSKNDHGLPHNPFKAIVSPRPIGWISTVDAQGRPNLAPYSFFNAICDTPPLVAFSSSGYKDSVSNIDETHEFVCNIVGYDLKDAMNASSAPLPHGVSEFERAGLEMADCRLVKAPRVAAAPAALECKHVQTIRLQDIDGKDTDNWMVIGQVVAVHVDDKVVANGRVDVTLFRPLSRLGYRDYASVDSVFEMTRPSS